jgi:hypothetical protein
MGAHVKHSALYVRARVTRGTGSVRPHAPPAPPGPHARISISSAEVERLADAVLRLSPCHRDPEAFHMNKAAIVGELHELARRMRVGG